MRRAVPLIIAPLTRDPELFARSAAWWPSNTREYSPVVHAHVDHWLSQVDRPVDDDTSVIAMIWAVSLEETMTRHHVHIRAADLKSTCVDMYVSHIISSAPMAGCAYLRKSTFSTSTISSTSHIHSDTGT